MKYCTVRIYKEDKELKVSFTKNSLEYKKIKTLPLANVGIFHYPETLEKSEAFSQLKNAMLKLYIADKEEVENIIKQLQNLEI